MTPRRLSRLPHSELPGGLRLYAADTALARMRGLARLERLPERHALLIAGCRSVHTFAMRFALDLVWLDGTGAVVRVDRGVGPRRLRTCLTARGVVEAGAGEGELFAAALARRRETALSAA